MRKRLFTIALAVGLLIGLLGAPAAADISDTGTITGEAQVGKTFWSEDDCDKTGKAVVVGEGLYLAGSPQDLERENQGAWHIRTDTAGALLGPVELEACGWLGPHDGTVTDPSSRTSGLGPACGASKGHHGMGEVRTLGGTPILKLIDLGWKDAVGGVLPVTGKYQQYNPDGTKQQKFGTVAAQVNARPAEADDCLSFPGAQLFTVTGTFELVNTMDQKPPKVDKEPVSPKRCKETDPNQDKFKDQVEGSDEDWKRPCPTARK